MLSGRAQRIARTARQLLPALSEHVTRTGLTPFVGPPSTLDTTVLVKDEHLQLGRRARDRDPAAAPGDLPDERLLCLLGLAVWAVGCRGPLLDRPEHQPTGARRT